MKKVLSWVGLVLLIMIVALVAAVALRQNRTFEAPLPAIAASQDSAILARGEYLFYGPAHCMDCHAGPEDLQKVEQGMRVLPKGGREWHLPMALLRSPNITSDKETGIGARSDAEIARALRYGVGHDGHALFDMMPFHNTSDEDLTAIISYVRTFPPLQNQVTVYEPNVLGRVLKAFVFQPVGPTGDVPKAVARDTTAAYGKYLAYSVANCYGCHTNRDLQTGAFIGPAFAGGFALPIDGEENAFCVTPNLTPDAETGRITTWTEERFIQRFRQGKLIKESEMPWGPFKSLSDNDLKAIYAFLKTLKPIKNETGPTIVRQVASR